MDAVPVDQHRQREWRGCNLLRLMPRWIGNRADDIILQGFIEKCVGGIAAGNGVLQGEISEAPPGQSRAGFAKCAKVVAKRGVAKKPTLLGGKQRCGSRRDLVDGHEVARQKQDRAGKHHRLEQAI